MKILVGLLCVLFVIDVSAQCIEGSCNYGKGKYRYRDGGIYEGDFKSKKRHGQGVYQYASGSSFRGTFIDGNRYYGIVRYANNSKYKGFFKNNKKHGRGNFYDMNGVVGGLWVNGKLVKKSKKPIKEVFAVIVGVADYVGNRFDLKFTDDDAKAFDAFLSTSKMQGINSSYHKLLINSQASKVNVIRYARFIFKMAFPEDVVVFYFSGHGSQKAFLPYDHDNGYINHSDIRKAFSLSKSNNKLCIVDACYSGGVVNNSQSHSYVPPSDEQQIAIFMSSRINEMSMEWPPYGHGLFTYWLLRGLKGSADTNRDRVVSIKEIFDFVSRRVVKDSRGRQHPTVYGKFQPSMPVFFYF